MFLQKLYSEPNGLFKTIEFKDGVNFIFGKKEKTSDPKESLNGIGKSLTLDFLDFCLLSSFQKNHCPRLFAASQYLLGYQICLEFEVDDSNYIIKRNIETPSKIIVGPIGEEKELSLKEAKEYLCDLIFKRNYGGYYSNSWLRKLLPFFIKIQKQKSDSFTDPIKYINENSVAELLQYHFFLLDIDNKLSKYNFELQSNIKQKEPALKEVKSIVEDTYELRDISEASNKIDILNKDIDKLEKAISNFKLSEEYFDVENDANGLTKKIKDIWFNNFSDRKKISSYEDSFKLDTNIDTKKIHNIYKQFNELLAGNIQKTLEEAVQFRIDLSKSRKEFILSEIEELKKIIIKRELEIEDLENKRAKLFTFLSSKKAIEDLSEAYLALTQKKDSSKDLEGKIRLYTDLSKELAELRVEEKKVEKDFIGFAEEFNGSISKFRGIFSDIYNAVYPQNKDESILSIKPAPNTNAKLEFNITFPSMYSKGRNQGRTLIYDLAMLIYMETNKIRGPRFLAHDGIFDGMDKAHFVSLYEYLENLKTHLRFQYIITMNEEGTLNDNFGNTDAVSPEKIAIEAIVLLTPNNKLLGKDFN